MFVRHPLELFEHPRSSGPHVASSLKVSTVLRVVEPASIDGASVFRLVSDGETSSVEVWRGSRGWVRGGASVGSFMKMLPASPAALKQLGIPVEGTRVGDAAA